MSAKAEAIRRGREWEIAAIVRGNRCEVADFIEALPISAQKKIVRLLRLIADAHEGPFTFRNEQKMRHLGDQFYELKSDQVRLLFFVDRPRRVVLTNGFLKRSQRTPAREIERASSQRQFYYEEAP